MQRKINRGILQDDSLSPLLFVLCIGSLSRRLNEKFPSVNIAVNDSSFSINHLLFIDDLKLLSTGKDNLKRMTEETARFFEKIGLEINRKSLLPTKNLVPTLQHS